MLTIVFAMFLMSFLRHSQMPTAPKDLRSIMPWPILYPG